MEFSRLIEEPGVVLFPDQFDIADRSVSLFGDDDLGLSSKFDCFVGFVVVLFAVDEHDDVGVLFDRTGLTEVAKPRSVVFGVFGLAVQLREAKHGNALFAGEHFESSGNFGDLFLTGVFGVVWVDQLQVIDDDQAEFFPALLAFHFGNSACDGCDLADGPTWGVVDEQGSDGDIGGVFDQSLLFFMGDCADPHS